MAEPAKSEASSNDSSIRRLQKGERVEATVVAIAKDRVFVNLGTKSEGVIPLNELTDKNVDSAEGIVAVNDKVTVVVLKPEGSDGGAVVSKKRAELDAAWHKVVAAFEAGEMVDATVVERVKGGLVVDVGVRGFVPATHVGSGKLRNIEKYVGQIIQLKVIEIDKERKKVVLSNREAEELRKEELKEQVFNDVNPGDVVDGTVRRITDYGAFVDMGGIDGLLHISEMSWMRISHPKEVLKEGQKVKVMVLKLDKGTGKISLGLRQTQPDPWSTTIKETYKIGQTLTVKIGRIVQSGAFIRLPEEAEAFLPLSEISHRRLSKPQEAIEEGQEVEVTVIDLRPEDRRMVLSMKAGQAMDSQIGYGYGDSIPTEYDSGLRANARGGGKGAPGGKKKKGGPRTDEDGPGTRGASGMGATIGDRLGALKGLNFRLPDGPETEEKSGE